MASSDDTAENATVDSLIVANAAKTTTCTDEAAEHSAPRSVYRLGESAEDGRAEDEAQLEC